MARIKNWKRAGKGKKVFRWINVQSGEMVIISQNKALSWILEFTLFVDKIKMYKKVKNEFETKKDACSAASIWMTMNPI